jgi:protein-L-isoaspartate(D-aspartate) O-methyltransferase
MFSPWVLGVFALSMTESAPADARDRFAPERARMVDEIADMARETGAETGRPRLGDAVMAALRKVPRDRFVPRSYAHLAHENRPLPIGEGQTISQPYIVALMTDLIDPKPEHVVLELGTGSAYQAAVLSELVQRVYTIEVVEPLAQRSAQLLKELGCENVVARAGDGYAGWAEHAPFDAIIVTAAAAELPQPLVDQLKPGGRMVIPVGGTYDIQHLLVVEKGAGGETSVRTMLPVRFVPLTRSR